MGCLAPCFARVEPRRQARKYVTGLISDVPRKNCWSLAESAGHEGWGRMQALLGRWVGGRSATQLPGLAAAWIPDAERDLIGPGIAIDETAHIKQGDAPPLWRRSMPGAPGRWRTA